MGCTVLQAPHHAVTTVRRALSLGSCSPSDSVFELLRATVWSLAAPTSTVHINRVLNTSLPSWHVLSERPPAGDETLRTELRAALSALADSGDLVELSGGNWAPGVPRLVELPDRLGYLVVGGVPSSLLPLEASAITFHGPHRHLVTPPPELRATLPTEDLRSWARMPDMPLQQWARESLESLERHSYSPTHSDVFEFYLPSASRLGAPQLFRWFESAGAHTGALLARRRRSYGAREYRLVDVHSGRIASSCDLHDFDVSRMMYAFDMTAHNPVRARPLRVAGRTEWLFTSDLPRAEQRTFAAFGTLAIVAERRFERRWTFLRHEALALDMMRSLGIAIGQSRQQDRQ